MSFRRVQNAEVNKAPRFKVKVSLAPLFENSVSGNLDVIDFCRVWILVIHYAFSEDKLLKRSGNARDLELLQNLFGEYQDCTFREIASPPSNEITKILSKDGIVSRFENRREGTSTIDIIYVHLQKYIHQSLVHRLCLCSSFYLMEVRTERFSPNKGIFSPFTTCGMPLVAISFYKNASKSMYLG
jgi:hypothetical protein